MGKKECGSLATKVVIIGAGGFAREVVDIFDACNRSGTMYDVIGYVVDREYGLPGTLINERPILGDFDWLRQHANDVHVICSIGAPQHRRQLVLRAKELGCRFCSVVHPCAVMTRWVKMGDGVVITAGCNITNQISLGNHVHVNLASTIGHNSILEDFVTLAPGAHISGNVTLGEGCYVGTGANIIEKIKVGAWSIVGAGSTIIKDVPANTTVFGVPGRIVETRERGWHQV